MADQRQNTHIQSCLLTTILGTHCLQTTKPPASIKKLEKSRKKQSESQSQRETMELDDETSVDLSILNCKCRE